MNISSVFTNVSNEVIMGIFSFLEAEEIIKIRGVCASWRDLIDQAVFLDYKGSSFNASLLKKSINSQETVQFLTLLKIRNIENQYIFKDQLQKELAQEALLWAWKKNQLEIITLLLKDPLLKEKINPSMHVVDVGYRPKWPRVGHYWGVNSIVQWAIGSGYKELVELLLKDERVNPSAGYVAMQCVNGKIEEMPHNTSGHTLGVAIQENQREIALLLLQDKRVDPSVDNNSAIRWASENNDREIVELLMRDERVDPSAKGNFAIQRASENNYKDIVELLMRDKRVDPSANDNFAIQRAIIKGYKEIVELLMRDKRVDPSANDNFAIQWASRNNHKEIVELLMRDKRVNPAANDYDAIVSAIFNFKEGGVRAAEILIQLLDVRVFPLPEKISMLIEMFVLQPLGIFQSLDTILGLDKNLTDCFQ